jgi:hypothetical protein
VAEKVNYKRMVKITYPERGISYAAQSVAKCARFERESSGALHQLLAGVQPQREEDPSGGFERGGWAAPYNAM